MATTFLICNSFKFHKCCEVHSAEEGGPGPPTMSGEASLNEWRVPRATCAPHVSPRPARRGPQHSTPRVPPPHHPLRCVCDITTWHGRHRVTQAAARRCKHIQMHMGGAPRSSCPPVTCATTCDAALEALLQARRTPSRASRKSMRVPSASGGARPARDSSCSAAARETSRRAAPCDPGRPMRFARVGAPQRRPVAPSQRGRARLILGSREAIRLYPTLVEIRL